MSCVIGITGSIATGKSTACRMLAQLGAAVFDADKAAHLLMQPGGDCFDAVCRAFPDSIVAGMVDRQHLGRQVFSNIQDRLLLESIMHPAVRAAEIAFIQRAQHQRRQLIVLDIPLLFETGAQNLCEQVWLVHCPPFLQAQRALRRAGMSYEKYQQILSRQMPQAEKRRYADRVIYSSLGKGAMMRQVKQAIVTLTLNETWSARKMNASALSSVSSRRSLGRSGRH